MQLKLNAVEEIEVYFILRCVNVYYILDIKSIGQAK